MKTDLPTDKMTSTETAIFTRIKKAYPHLATMTDRASQGDPRARKALSDNISRLSARLSPADHLEISGWGME